MSNAAPPNPTPPVYSYAQNRIVGGIAADDRFWQSLEEGVFRLPRCAQCRRWTWPAHWRCGRCGSWDFDWVDVEPAGTIYAWTRTWYPFEQVTERAAESLPYVTALVEVDGTDETTVLGVLKGDDSRLACGVRVRGEIDPPSPVSKGYPCLRWIIEEGK